MTGMFRDQRLTGSDCRRGAIERDHIGASRKDRRRITASPERSIEDDLAGRRSQRLQYLGKKNRNVANRSATGIRRTSA